MLPVHGSAKHADMVAATIKTFQPAVAGPCFFTDPSVREKMYPVVVVCEKDVCIAVCPAHHVVHYCLASCKRAVDMGSDTDIICEITLMPRPAQSASFVETTDVVLERYRSIHNITYPLIMRSDLCSSNCQRWYSFPEGSYYVCLEHNCVHSCNAGKCHKINGRCAVSGIEGASEDMDVDADEPAAASAPASSTATKSRHSCVRVGNFASARSEIAVVAARVFAHTLECQERIDQWCNFVFDFLAAVECATAVPLHPYICAVFQQCYQDGLVVRSVRCLPGHQLQDVLNIRESTASETSKAAAHIMLNAADRLTAVTKVYNAYFF